MLILNGMDRGVCGGHGAQCVLGLTGLEESEHLLLKVINEEF